MSEAPRLEIPPEEVQAAVDSKLEELRQNRDLLVDAVLGECTVILPSRSELVRKTMMAILKGIP